MTSKRSGQSVSWIGMIGTKQKPKQNFASDIGLENIKKCLGEDFIVCRGFTPGIPRR